MASSNIKLFDENKGNMLNDTEFNISTQRLNGLQAGVASSQLQNKAMYQASLIAYAIAQLMLANGKNANDTDAVSTFVNNLLASIVQKVADKATKQDITDGTVGKWISSELLKSNNEDVASTYLKLAGGTMLGNLLLNADPTSALQAVTKRYVDNNFAKIQTGSYTGTGTSGQSNPCSLTFNFVPKFVFLYMAYSKTGWSSSELSFTRYVVQPWMLSMDDLMTNYADSKYKGNGRFKFQNEFESTSKSCIMYAKKSSDGKTLTWYADDAQCQLNQNAIDSTSDQEIVYRWIAIG